MPPSWNGGRKNYPYYTWLVRVEADLAGAVDYRDVFRLSQYSCFNRPAAAIDF
jgi:hypothetical protein